MANLILWILLIIEGVRGESCEVRFRSHCAIRGASVLIPCTFSYPRDKVVAFAYWSKAPEVMTTGALFPLDTLSSLKHRFRYLGNKRGNCTLAIDEVRPSDQGAYLFSFVTGSDICISEKYSALTVKELIATVAPTTVKRGEGVGLTCWTQCPQLLSSNQIMWLRDGLPVPRTRFKARVEDAGSYQCGITGQVASMSVPAPLDVQYLPENTSISMDPPRSVARGSGVNLTCSSSANPAVSSYTWFRRTGTPSSNSTSMVQFGRGRVLKLPSLETSDSGYYLCQARNSLGENNSTELLLDTQENLANQPHAVFYGIGVTVFVALVLVFGFLLLRRKQKTNKSKQSVAAPHRPLTPPDPQPVAIYANMELYPPQTHPTPDSAHSAQEAEVIYSTVTVQKLHNTNLQDRASRSLNPEFGDTSVIYSTVTQQP